MKTAYSKYVLFTLVIPPEVREQLTRLKTANLNDIGFCLKYFVKNERSTGWHIVFLNVQIFWISIASTCTFFFILINVLTSLWTEFFSHVCVYYCEKCFYFSVFLKTTREVIDLQWVICRYDRTYPNKWTRTTQLLTYFRIEVQQVYKLYTISKKSKYQWTKTAQTTNCSFFLYHIIFPNKGRMQALYLFSKRGLIKIKSVS